MGLKQSEKALKNAERKLAAELEKQVFVIYGSVGIALFNEWGWGQQRIMDLYDLTDDVWHEVGADNRQSMLQILEQETGIEIKLTDTDKSWHDLDYLNGSLHIYEDKTMTLGEAIYMRLQQTRWMGAMIQACVFVALHRKCGFGPTRLKRLMDQVEDIRARSSNKPKRIVTECAKVTGINLVQKLKGKRI